MTDSKRPEPVPSEEAEWPDLLMDLAGWAAHHAEKRGVAPHVATAIGEDLVEAISEGWGATQVYIPRGVLAKMVRRNVVIFRRWLGGGQPKDIARELGVSVQRVYQIVNPLHKRYIKDTRPALFPLEPYTGGQDAQA